MPKVDFDTIFNPQSVAFIGASANGRGGANFIRCYQEFGFKGRIYPVNPNASEIMGFKATPT